MPKQHWSNRISSLKNMTICAATTSIVVPASLCSRVSPMQAITLIPWESAYAILKNSHHLIRPSALSAQSVPESPKAPAVGEDAHLISPVKAPPLRTQQFCAATEKSGRSKPFTCGRNTNGGLTTTS
ncbi:Os01g0841650, partial [Oryza sativa Japonica Group]